MSTLQIIDKILFELTGESDGQFQEAGLHLKICQSVRTALAYYKSAADIQH